jgi:hypothetical protein
MSLETSTTSFPKTPSQYISNYKHLQKKIIALNQLQGNNLGLQLSSMTALVKIFISQAALVYFSYLSIYNHKPMLALRQALDERYTAITKQENAHP